LAVVIWGKVERVLMKSFVCFVLFLHEKNGISKTPHAFNAVEQAHGASISQSRQKRGHEREKEERGKEEREKKEKEKSREGLSLSLSL
jgi:ribosomal protein L12E/L44/L45/RPP1/RPP2